MTNFLKIHWFQQTLCPSEWNWFIHDQKWRTCVGTKLRTFMCRVLCYKWKDNKNRKPSNFHWILISGVNRENQVRNSFLRPMLLGVRFANKTHMCAKKMDFCKHHLYWFKNKQRTNEFVLILHLIFAFVRPTCWIIGFNQKDEWNEEPDLPCANRGQRRASSKVNSGSSLKEANLL